MVWHVGDLTYAGNDEFKELFIKNTKERSLIRKEDNVCGAFKYIRLNVSQSAEEKRKALEQWSAQRKRTDARHESSRTQN